MFDSLVYYNFIEVLMSFRPVYASVVEPCWRCVSLLHNVCWLLLGRFASWIPSTEGDSAPASGSYWSNNSLLLLSAKSRLIKSVSAL